MSDDASDAKLQRSIIDVVGEPKEAAGAERNKKK
jgi:hypothetical protein